MAAGTGELNSLLAELVPLLERRDVDVSRPDRADIDGKIEAVRVSIRPLQLHPHLVWFWQQWPRFGRECTFPGFGEPAVAQDVHQALPKALLEIGHGDGGHYLLADLTTGHDGGPGPLIYGWSQAWWNECRLLVAGVTDLMRYMVAIFDLDREVDFIAQADRLEQWLPPTVHDELEQPVDLGDAATWPERWRRAEGLTNRSFTSRGATHTVAALETARRRGSVKATLVGNVRNLAGSAAGTLVRLTDGTGSVQILVPAALAPLGRSPSETYEIDVVAEPLNGPERSRSDTRETTAEIQRLALSGDIEAAARAAVPLGHYVNGPHPIVATAKRPIR